MASQTQAVDDIDPITGKKKVQTGDGAAQQPQTAPIPETPSNAAPVKEPNQPAQQPVTAPIPDLPAPSTLPAPTTPPATSQTAPQTVPIQTGSYTTNFAVGQPGGPPTGVVYDPASQSWIDEAHGGGKWSGSDAYMAQQRDPIAQEQARIAQSQANAKQFGTTFDPLEGITPGSLQWQAAQQMQGPQDTGIAAHAPTLTESTGLTGASGGGTPLSAQFDTPATRLDGSSVPADRGLAPTPAVPGGLTLSEQLGQQVAPFSGSTTQNPPNPYPTVTPTSDSSGVNQTKIDPTNDLRSQTLSLGTDPRLATTQNLTDQAVGNLTGGPDRTALAKQALSDFIAQQEEQYGRDVTKFGQDAASLGRVGLQANNRALSDLLRNLESDRLQKANELAMGVPEGDINDRYRTLSALTGLEGQQFGQNETNFQNTVGQQSRQDTQAQRAKDNAFRQEQQTEQEWLDRIYGGSTLLGAGESGDPTQLRMTIASNYGQEAASAFDAMATLAEKQAFKKALDAGYPVQTAVQIAKGGGAPGASAGGQSSGGGDSYSISRTL